MRRVVRQPAVYRPRHLSPQSAWYTPEAYFDLYPLNEIALALYPETDRDDLPEWQVSAGESRGLGYGGIPKLSEPDKTEVKHAMQGYLASISFADTMVGKLIKALDESGRADSTTIVLWSDHGWHLGEKDTWGKFTLWERSSHVPFLILAPGVTRAGTRSDEAVSLQSVYATLADLAGLDLPAHVDGASLRLLLENPEATSEDVAFTFHQLGAYAVQDDQWRYIRYEDGAEELYNHAVDPNEWTNLAGDPEHTERLEAMRKKAPPADEQAAPQILD
ncbi:MAG: sulfatase-like hydrolase/transferase [Erythrobacter sp.]|nr:sulfatase-like hydrolase/transferase [Erythrobacter sp.]